MNFAGLAAKGRAFCARAGSVLWSAVNKYVETDGELRAASFAYYAFFAFFPLTLLLISIASWFIGDEQKAAQDVLELLNHYVPHDPEGENLIAGTIREVLASTFKGVAASRGVAGLIAVLALLWSALRFFQALVQGVNRAWGLEGYSWWRLPLANLGMVGITASTLFLGVVGPVVMKTISGFWQEHNVAGFNVMEVVTRLSQLILPSFILFYGLLMFYKYAPRRKTTFKEVWFAALVAALGLQVVSKGIVVYADNFARFNKLYGALGSVVAVLMWIYFSGSVIIFCGCLSAAQAQAGEPPEGGGTSGKD